MIYGFDLQHHTKILKHSKETKRITLKQNKFMINFIYGNLALIFRITIGRN